MIDQSRAARQLLHEALQALSRAARANLPATTDDSHAAFQWVELDRTGFATRSLTPTVALMLGFDPARYVLRSNDVVAASLPLAGQDCRSAAAWLENELTRRGFKAPGNAEMPYELPFQADWSAATELAPAIAELGALYGAASAGLADFAATLPSLAPGPSPVTLWPHHFDIATLVQLQPGDAATAPAIGVGVSPGDENYADAYLYCSPYPQPDRASLDAPPEGWQWHTEGFVSLVMTDPKAAAPWLANGFRQAFSVALTHVAEVPA